jgi:hypothetical protein
MKNMLGLLPKPRGKKDLKNQCWVVLRKRHRYLSVINSGIYTLAHWLVLRNIGRIEFDV